MVDTEILPKLTKLNNVNPVDSTEEKKAEPIEYPEDDINPDDIPF
jgi:hypothetical protein